MFLKKRRLLAAVVALAMVVNAYTPVFAAIPDKAVTDPYSMTEGELVAHAYDELSEAEKNLLKDGEVTVGKTYPITRPASSDNLVAINQEAKTIKADSFENGELTWVPVSAVLTEDGSATENVALDAEGNGTFASTADNYSVTVKYALSVDVDEALQTSMVKTPGYLKDAVDNLKAVEAKETVIKEFQEEIPTLYSLATEGVQTPLSKVKFFQKNKQPMQEILDLKAEYDANGGKLDVFKMLQDYKAIGTDTSAKLEYLLAGNRVDNAMVSLYEKVTALQENFDGLYDLIKDQDLIEDATDMATLTTAHDAFALLVEALSPVATKGEWAIFTEDLALVDNVDTDKLAVYVDALDAPTGGSVTVAKTIEVETVDVEAAVNLVNVTIKVTGKKANGVAGSKDFAAMPEYTAVVKVSKGTAKAEYIAKAVATGKEAEAVAAWGIDAAHFNVVTNEAELPAATVEGEDLVYTIEYSPKEYKITEDWSGGKEVDVHYGYIYEFPDHTNPEQAYIYTVSGNKYEQHETYTVEGDVTVTRVADKAKLPFAWNKIVSDSVSSLSAKEKAILASDAIDHGSIRVKVPAADANNPLATANITEKTVTAKTYDAGYENRVWVPETVYVDGVKAGTFAEDGDAYKATYTGDGTKIEVGYVLVVENAEGEAIANLPHTLSEEAKDQKEALDDLYGYKGTIESNVTYLSIVDLVINGTSYNFTQSVKDAYANLTKYGMTGSGDTAKMNLATELGYYHDQGLAYYYTGGDEKIAYQVELLEDFCVELIDDGANEAELVKALGNYSGLLDAQGMTVDEVVGKFDSILGFLAAYNPPAPNAAIDADANVAGLAAALVAEGTTSSGHNVERLYLSAKVAAEVAGKATVTFIEYTNGAETGRETYVIEDATVALTQDDYNKAMAKWNVLEADNDPKHYTMTGEEVEGTALKVGEIPASFVTYIRNWTPVSYTVKIEGETDKTFVFNGSKYTINLPGAPEGSGLQYIYNVPGKGEITVNEGDSSPVTYTVDEMDAVCDANRVVTITRTAKDVSVIVFDSLISTMNSNMAAAANGGELGFAFMPFEKDGDNAVVMRVAYKDGLDVMGIMQALGTALATGYSNAEIGGHTVWDGELSIQGMTNAFIDAGFGMDSVDKIIDDNGNIINLKLDNYTYLLNDVENYGGATLTKGALGGELIKTTLTYTDKGYGVTDTVDFYITLATDKNLAKVDKALNWAANYANINSVDGKVQIDMNIPEEIYALYMTYMLAEQEITLDTFNDVELETLLGYAKDVAEPLIADLAAGEKYDADRFFTELVIENTLKQYMPGNTTDLSSYGSVMKKGVKLVDKLLTEVKRDNVTYNGDSCSVTLTVEGVRDMVAGYVGGNGEFVKDFIVDEPLTVDVKLTLANVNTVYEAYVVEIPADMKSAEDIKNITKEDIKGLLKLTSDLEATLKAAKGPALVVLLEDAKLDEAVTLNSEYIVIDLNGHTITGDMTAAGTAIVVDDTLSTANAGGVKGTLSGNFKLFAGNYTSVEDAMIPEEYEFEDGYVSNKYYYLKSTENEGKLEEVTIVLKDGVFDLTKDDLKKGLVDTLVSCSVNAVVNVSANLYGYNTAEVNGTWLYSFGDKNVIDMVNVAKGGKNAIINEILGYVNPTAVEEIANSVLAAFVGENAIVNAAAADTLYSCNLTLSPWDILYSIEGGTSDDAYFNVAYAGDKDNQVNVKLSFAMEEQLDALLTAIGEVVTINAAKVDLPDELTYSGGKSLSSFGISRDDFGGEIDVVVDFTKDTNYAIILAAVLANAGDKAAYSSAVNNLIDNGSQAELKSLIDKTTVAGLIDALEKANGKSFAAMLGALNINDAARVEEIKTLEAKYSDILKAIYLVFDYVDLTGPATKLGSVETEFGVYYKEAKKYNIDGKATVKLFTNKAEIVSVTPVIDMAGDAFYGFQFDEKENLLIVDTVVEGITEADLKALVQYTVNEATTDHSLTVAAEDLKDGKVINGAKLTIRAWNDISEDEREYTVIVLGDTNSSGKIEVGDATRIARHKLGQLTTPMTDVQLLAADTNMDGDINVGDPVKISVKWMCATSDEYLVTYPDGYNTALTNKIIK